MVATSYTCGSWKRTDIEWGWRVARSVCRIHMCWTITEKFCEAANLQSKMGRSNKYILGIIKVIAWYFEIPQGTLFRQYFQTYSTCSIICMYFSLRYSKLERIIVERYFLYDFPNWELWRKGKSLRIIFRMLHNNGYSGDVENARDVLVNGYIFSILISLHTQPTHGAHFHFSL